LTALLTKSDAARRLNVSTRTIDEYCRRRLLRFSRIPAGKRFRIEDLDAFVNAHMVGHEVTLPRVM
jgi:excisionase family DNA binding protein